MQKYVLSALCLISVITLAGCVSTEPRSEYFGYNNITRSEETTPVVKKENNWQNPLRDASQNEDHTYTADYRSYGYIPVIVPWWDGYYNWPGFSRTYIRFSYGYPGYYYPPYYPWYSPWYDYNPFYGGVFYYPEYRYWHRPWYSDWRPVTPITPTRTGVRNFGSQRGQFTPENGNNSRTGGSGGNVITTGGRVRNGGMEKNTNTPDELKTTEPKGGGVITTGSRTRSDAPEKKGNAPDEIKVIERRDVPATAPASEPIREPRREISPANTMRTEPTRESVAPPRAAERPQKSQPMPTNSRRRNP